MPKGPAGVVDRPFADSVISINVEFYGEPQTAEGPNEGVNKALKRVVESALDDVAEETGHHDSNRMIEEVIIYPAELMFEDGKGFEVEIEMEPDGMMILQALNKVEEEVDGFMHNEHRRTAVIAL